MLLQLAAELQWLLRVPLGEERLEVLHDDVRVVVRLQEPVRLVTD